MPDLTQHHAALAAAGLDLSRLRGLPWPQILAAVQVALQALQDALARSGPMAATSSAAPGFGADHAAHLRAILDMQAQLAECGLKCLDACQLD